MVVSLASTTQDSVSQPLTVVITPSRAQSYSICPYRYANEPRRFDRPSKSQDLGQWVHELIHEYNRARMAGSDVDVEEIVVRRPPPLSVTQDKRGEDWAFHIAQDSVDGYRAFLQETGADVIRDAERYVRTPARAVAGVAGCHIVFSGRFDVTAERHDGTLVCIDVKSGVVLGQAQLADAPSSFVYHHLVEYAYGNAAIDIVQFNPLTGRYGLVQLDDVRIQRGKAFCRSMAASIVTGQYRPIPGEYCAYCALAPTCPAHDSQRPGWDTEF